MKIYYISSQDDLNISQTKIIFRVRFALMRVATCSHLTIQILMRVVECFYSLLTGNIHALTFQQHSYNSYSLELSFIESTRRYLNFHFVL